MALPCARHDWAIGFPDTGPCYTAFDANIIGQNISCPGHLIFLSINLIGSGNEYKGTETPTCIFQRLIRKDMVTSAMKVLSGSICTEMSARAKLTNLHPAVI